MFNFLHTFEPTSIAFSLGAISVHWYGLMITLGAILGITIAVRLAEKYKIEKDHILNLSFWVIIFGIIGARIYYVLYAWEYYGTHLIDSFKLWEGGIAIHGAIIGGILTIYVYTKKHNLPLLVMADIVVVGVVVGQIIGRWGNYFNQELFGKPTGVPWGIPIDISLRPEEYLGATYFHPTFLYESILNFLVLGILLLWHKIRIKKSSGERGAGWIAFTYVILYSAIRFSMEFLRIDFSPVVFGIRWAQLFSAVIVVLGLLFVLVYFLFLKRRRFENIEK